MKVYKRDQSDKEKERSKRGKSARRSGHDFERWVVNRYKEGLKDFHAERGLQMKGGRGRADVRLTGALHEFHNECKKGIQPNIRAAYAQAVSDSKFGSIPTAITKAKGEPALVTRSFDDDMAILQALEGIDQSGTVILKVRGLMENDRRIRPPEWVRTLYMKDWRKWRKAFRVIRDAYKLLLEEQACDSVLIAAQDAKIKKLKAELERVKAELDRARKAHLLAEEAVQSLKYGRE
jgi:hypothetical protein